MDIASNVFSINAVNTATLFVPKGSESSYYTGGWTIFCNVVGGEFVGVYPGSVGDEKDLTFSYYKVKDAVAEGSEQTYTRSAILTKSVSSRGDVNIPASIKAEELQPDGKKQWFDYNVTSIGASSFTTSRNLTNLTVPDGVVSIGKSAFSGFSSLAKVELPLSLSSIGDAAFAGSENIAEIISDMVSAFNISDDVFDSKVYNIATVYIQDGSKDSYLQADGWKNFVAGHFDEGKWQETAQAVNNLKYRYHTGKKKATVTAIEFPASETSLTIPGSIKFAENGPEYSVEEVSPSSFDNKDKVQTLTIGDGVKTISSGVFKDCKSLTSVVLPSSLTSISDNLFQGCSSLSSLSLPSTLTSIGNDAFQGCSSLTELPLSSVTSIGANAFKGCTGLTSLSLPSTLATIGDNSFSGTNLATLTISEGLKSIGSGAFSGTKLTELRLPESVETIGTGAFQNNSSLKNVWLPSTLTSIGSGAFGSCTNIVNVSIQRESLLEIGADVFSITSKTSTLFVPNGMTETYYTGGWAQFPNIVGGEFLGVFTGKESDGDAKNMTFSYYRVKNVGNASEGNDTEVSYTRQAILTRSETTDKSVRVPDKIQAEELQPDGITKVWYNYDVVSLGSSSFATSRNLENLALVPGIKSIGKSAFENCSGLQTLELPLTLASIGSGAFSSSYDIVKIVSDVVTAFNISADVFTDKVYKNAELYVPDEGADSYASESAGGWNNFVNVEKGKWVDSDYEGIFKYRYHTSKKDAIVTGIAFSGDGDTPLEIPSSVEIKGTKYYVNSISPTTFDNKDKVKTLIIKDKDWTSEDGVAKSGIGVIGGNAFQNCTSLTKVVLPSSVVTIGDNAFQGCTNLQKLWLPATLTSIGSKAFNGCNLTRVTCETLPDIEGDVFSSYRNAYLFIPEGTTVKGRAGWGEFSKVYVGCYEGESISSDDKKSYLYLKQSDDSRTAILMKYENTDNIISPVEFEDNKYDVTIIAESACSGVTLDNDVLTLPNTIKEIEKKAFQNQRNLKSITLPSSLKTIGDYAFQGCSGLKTLELPTTLTSIGEGAFSGNTNVAEVTLPDNINTIGELAFQNCNSIKKIELPSTLTKIGANAFDGCNNLTEVISNITDETVITSNAPSMPNAILYVPNHKDLYESAGWGFAHIYEGKRVEKEIEGLYYAYAENADATNKEAVLVKVDSEKISEKVIIPNSIKDEKGYDYNVIAIDNYVFQGCTNLKTVELPSTLTAIGTGAFDGCSNLTDVVSNITDQGVIGQIALSLPNADLYVPDGTKAYYSSEESSWKFANYYVGSRIEVTVNGLNYVCATGDKNAFLVGVAENGIAEDGIVIIPASITVGEGETAKDYAVIAINDDAFSGNTNVKSVKVGDGIKTIGANAFLGCNNLSKVWLPVSLNEIGEKAFDGCRNIAYICTKQNAPIDIKNVFSSYNATLYVPNEEAKGNYEKDEFWNKFNNKKTGYLVDVTTQDNITYECVVNGDAATALLVKSESTATDVEIPSSVKLDDDTEYKVTTISKQTFKGNGNITTLRIGENVKTIEDEAFQNCGKLQKVWLPSTLESIGGKAFNGSRSITRISTKTKTLPTIGSDVLPENIAYLFIPEGTEFKDLVGWNSFAKVVEGHYVGDVTSDNISYICIESGSSADKTAMLVKAPKTASTFKTSVDLHEVSYALTTIGEAAFEDNTAFVNLVIPEGVKTIEANAFKNCSKLHSVVLPSTLEKIGDKAFKGSSIAFLQNYVEDPYEIADSVFTDGVYNNATLYVPENATDKYTSAGGWKNFKSVVGGIASEVTIEDMTYICVTGSEKRVAKLTKGSSKIKEVKVPAKLFTDDVKYQVTEIDKSAFEGNNSLEKVIVSEGIKTIGQSAFKQCSNLKSLVLPASLETVGDYAFDNCTRLATVTCAGEKPVDISDNVFSVTALEVNVPSRSAVKAFEEHKVWGSFDIYYSMTSSGDNGTTDADVATYQVITPEGDDAISIVAIVDGDNIPDDFSIPSVVEHNGVSYSVGAIAPSAFENKTSLKNVTIPGTVSWIGDAAFAGCSNLQSITVDNTEPPTQIGSSTVAGSRRMFTRGTEGSSIFEGVDVDKCILYVPEESIEKYKASTIWGVFKNIQAISATALDGITVTDDATFDVYNLQGRKVKSGVTTLKGLTPGVYIVKGKKVVLK